MTITVKPRHRAFGAEVRGVDMRRLPAPEPAHDRAVTPRVLQEVRTIYRATIVGNEPATAA